MFNFLRKTMLWIILLPWAIFGVGVASNQLVLVANHGKFPIMETQTQTASIRSVQIIRIAELEQEIKDGEDSSDQDESLAEIAILETALKEGMIDDVHCFMTDKTRLNWLADIFNLRIAIFSVGDGMLNAAEAMQTYCLFAWILLMSAKSARQEK